MQAILNPGRKRNTSESFKKVDWDRVYGAHARSCRKSSLYGGQLHAVLSGFVVFC